MKIIFDDEREENSCESTFRSMDKDIFEALKELVSGIKKLKKTI